MVPLKPKGSFWHRPHLFEPSHRYRSAYRDLATPQKMLHLRQPLTSQAPITGKKSRDPRSYDGDLFMHYNFVRIHQTLKATPAMVAGVASKLWEMPDMVKVLED